MSSIKTANRHLRLVLPVPQPTDTGTVPTDTEATDTIIQLSMSRILVGSMVMGVYTDMVLGQAMASEVVPHRRKLLLRMLPGRKLRKITSLKQADTMPEL